MWTRTNLCLLNDALYPAIPLEVYEDLGDCEWSSNISLLLADPSLCAQKTEIKQ